MIKELSEIKILRKRLGLTQNQLADQSGVSQSLIAKVEAGMIDPTYTNAMKIFRTLEQISSTTKLKAHELMNKKVVTANPGEKLAKVIADMKKYGISQLPVMHGNDLVGMISDSIILEAMLAGKKHTVEQVMIDRPPTISKDTDLDVISGLLKYFPMVTVFDKNKLLGIITKQDIIEKL